MIEEDNNIVKQQLMRQLKEFASKESMISYYMSYDHPEKQQGVKRWWEDLVQNVVRKKNQIFVNFKDLEAITTINGMKPVPLKNVLKQLKTQFVFVKQQDLTHQKKPQKRPNPWYNNILSMVWTNPKPQLQHPFRFLPDQKIISMKTKQRKKKQLISLMQKQFQHQNSKLLRNLIKQMSWKLKIDEISIGIILNEMKKQRQVVLMKAEQIGDTVLIYDADRRKMFDENFIKIEKIKCILRGTLHKFEAHYEKSSVKISNLKLKAKEALINDDRNKAKVLLAQVKKQQQHRQNIDLRKQVLDQKVAQIQLNDMNKSSIDLLQDAQNVYQQVAVDSQKLEEVLDKSREIQMESEQANRNFAQLAASQEIADEVDDLMRQLEQETKQKKKVAEQKPISPRNVRVEIQNNFEKDLQIDKPYFN